MSDDHKQRIMNAMRKFDERVATGKFKPKREKKKKDPDALPTEHQEQVMLVNYMRKRGWTFCAVPNGGSRASAIEGARLRASGLQKGFPDMLVFWPIRAAIELKRQKGGRVSQEQQAWLDTLQGCGWQVQVCRGAEAAISWLEEIHEQE